MSMPESKTPVLDGVVKLQNAAALVLFVGGFLYWAGAEGDSKTTFSWVVFASAIGSAVTLVLSSGMVTLLSLVERNLRGIRIEMSETARSLIAGKASVCGKCKAPLGTENTNWKAKEKARASKAKGDKTN